MHPTAQANQLVQEVERLRGLPQAPLGPEDQVAFGTLMFKYLPDQNRLVAAILVTHFDLWNRFNDEFTRNYRRSIAALSDPAIGGMFDTAGGAWMFEEATGKTYLYRLYPLETPPATINRDLDRMAEVVPAWASRWTGAVADIAQGKAPPPRRPVTLADDPYAGQL